MTTDPQDARRNLLDRLRGKYVTPVNDGAGLLDGKDYAVRHFVMQPICAEAADEIERLEREIARLKAELEAANQRLAGEQAMEDIANRRAETAERTAAQMLEDAERYRWLRSQPMLEGHALVSLTLMDVNEDGPTGCYYAYDDEALDAAIDSARKAP